MQFKVKVNMTALREHLATTTALSVGLTAEPVTPRLGVLIGETKQFYIKFS